MSDKPNAGVPGALSESERAELDELFAEGLEGCALVRRQTVRKLRAELDAAREELAKLRPKYEALCSQRLSEGQCPCPGCAAARAEGFARGVDAARKEAAALTEQWLQFAKNLQREVGMGIAVRQSAESKLSRAQVLKSNAEQLERVMRLLLPAQAPAPEHWCCDHYIGYGTACQRCGKECGCGACEKERAGEGGGEPNGSDFIG